MLSQLTIPKNETHEAALDHEQLYAIGLSHVQKLSSRVWTDYNVHDPGITILELLCYALTDLGYRASFSIKDLLSSESDNAKKMKEQFFTARQILPNRPLTLLDYRKLLIDLPGVKNAWLNPATVTYYADSIEGKLLSENPNRAGISAVSLAGLYDVIIEYMDDITTDLAKNTVMTNVKKLLQENRNLCEDFVNFTEVETQPFILCGEFTLAPDADVENVKAEILFQVQQYLSPPVVNYSLSEMLEKTDVDGTLYTADKIFDGPTLACGFIDSNELKAADLRTEIRLSDMISIIMDIKGVLAVRDIIINPEGASTALANKWIVPVASGKKAFLRNNQSRLVFYKRNMPVSPNETKVGVYYKELTDAATAKVETAVAYDFDIPLGKYRQIETYYSFQNHFPALYGISDAGLSSTVSQNRQAQAYQLKGYLLFFDQIMANYFSQLSHVKDLFSTDPEMKQTYFYQVVNSFAEYTKIYKTDNPVAAMQNHVENKDVLVSRRNRFLDHLISRFAERFSDYAQIMYSAFGATPQDMLIDQCNFLNHYPEISSERSLAYNDSLKESGDLWDTDNVSGLEKRLAKLLGIKNHTRRNLSTGEGMYLIENILLRKEQSEDPFLPICIDPNCGDCAEKDPYSYRIHIILPADSIRFRNMDFRRFAEEVIRAEVPAHILPKICWINKEDMADFEILYRYWIILKAKGATENRTSNLTEFIKKLFEVKNIYPSQRLNACDSPENEPKFILGQTAIGTQDQNEA